MPINADKPHLWKADTRASVDQFNSWFTQFAPKAYRDERKHAIEEVERGLRRTNDLTCIAPDIIRADPGILRTLRMATCPPLARDRLIGLANSSKNFVGRVEEGKIPPKLSPELVLDHLGRISAVIAIMLDVEILPWLEEKRA
ncbi:MAG: XamI family restriction endonuclease [Terracidiphilus sp.]